MLVLGQRAVGTAATFICTLPPGPARLTLVAGTATSIAVGAVPPGTPGTASSVTSITTGTGALIPASSSVTYDQRPGSSGADIYGAAASATTASYHITTDS